MKIEPVKDWELERYLLGELPSSRMDEIKKSLEADSNLREKMTALERSNKEILAHYPPEAVVPRIKIQLEAEQKGRPAQPILIKRLLYATPVLAAAFIAFLIIFQNPGNRTTQDIQGLQGTRVKGTETIDVSKPHILVHRKIDNNVELLETGDKAHAGDLVQIAYVAAGQAYGVIFSIDGRGVVTLHYPDSVDKTPVLNQDQRTLLPASYELDDAPDFERFFFVTSKSEIDVQAILNAAKILAKNPKTSEMASLDLPDSFSQYSLLIIKGE